MSNPKDDSLIYPRDLSERLKDSAVTLASAMVEVDGTDPEWHKRTRRALDDMRLALTECDRAQLGRREESKDERRLRVIVEFFEACGYVVRDAAVSGLHPMYDFVMTPPEGEEICKVFAPEWVESRQALRAAAAEAADHDCDLLRRRYTVGGAETVVRESFTGRVLGVCVGVTYEAALVAVTRALKEKKSCSTPTSTT